MSIEESWREIIESNDVTDQELRKYDEFVEGDYSTIELDPDYGLLEEPNDREVEFEFTENLDIAFAEMRRENYGPNDPHSHVPEFIRNLELPDSRARRKAHRILNEISYCEGRSFSGKSVAGGAVYFAANLVAGKPKITLDDMSDAADISVASISNQFNLLKQDEAISKAYRNAVSSE